MLICCARESLMHKGLQQNNIEDEIITIVINKIHGTEMRWSL